MGEILKNAYAERDLAKALAKAHGLIDEETRKLSDKLHELELSHNRKYQLLQKIENKLKNYKKNVVFMDGFGEALIDDVLFQINKELTYCERVKGVF